MNVPESSDLTDEHAIDAAFRVLWPSEMTADETRVWSQIPLVRKRKAYLRLAAIKWFAEQSDEQSERVKRNPSLVERAASKAGTSVPTFYRLAQRWKEAPGLNALGIQVSRLGPIDTEQSSQRERMLSLVREALEVRPDTKVSELQTLIASEVGHKPGFATARRLAQEARSSMPPTRPFGKQIILDAAGLDLINCDGERMRLFTVLDSGTGVILGWSVSEESDAWRGYQRAVQDFNDGHPFMSFQRGILSKGIRGVWSTFPETVEIHLPPDIEKRDQQMDDEIILIHDKRLGRGLIDAVGERLGGVWMGSGSRQEGVSFRNNRQSAMPTTGTVTTEAIGRDIDRHNETRLRLMSSDDDPNADLHALADLRRILWPYIANDDDR